ncbi:aldo/keto reductase family domain-containing protein [Phthorimaea operculella]|nr:aldo/keto reductase family domain-containing protein [Phthorimaea operculella]
MYNDPKIDNSILKQIARSHNKTVPQIALRYLYERGIVAIPKTLTKQRVVENASIFDFELDKGERDLLACFDNGFRTVNPTFWQDYTHYPFEKVSVPYPKIQGTGSSVPCPKNNNREWAAAFRVRRIITGNGQQRSLSEE